MTGTKLEFSLVDGGRVVAEPRRLVIAGYTGRDDDAVRRHIDELAEQGIAPPPTVPMFYELDPALLSTGARLSARGTQTCGEVEPVYLRASGHWYLGVGSDHTDRALEREDIATSKAACGKPIGNVVMRLPDDVLTGGFDRDFDAVTVTSWVDDTLYQQDSLGTVRPPSDILTRLFAALGPDGESDMAVFGGTVPLRSGSFVFGSAWRLRLDAGAPVPIEHAYTVTSGPSD